MIRIMAHGCVVKEFWRGTLSNFFRRLSGGLGWKAGARVFLLLLFEFPLQLPRVCKVRFHFNSSACMSRRERLTAPPATAPLVVTQSFSMGRAAALSRGAQIRPPVLSRGKFRGNP